MAKIQNKCIRGLIDTGSGTTLIKSTVAKKLNLSVRPIEQGQLSCLYAAEGSKLIVEGVTDITFNIGGLLIAHTVYVVKNIAESLIFGSDFLSDNQVIIDYSNKVVSMCSDLIRAPLIRNGDGQHVARLTKTICIPPGCEQIVNIKCSPRFSNTDVLVEAVPSTQFSKFAVARTICHTDTKSQTIARMLNCMPESLVLRKGTNIATVNYINVEKSCEQFQMPPTQAEDNSQKSMPKLTPQELNQFASDYGFKINPDLTETQRNELLSLLHKYRACFARNMKEIRRYKHYELELELKDKTPSFRRQYKLSQHDAQECHRQIKEMADCGIIEPSQNSMYQSAMFTVNKASGQKRAVLDLRAINEKIQPFLLQLPDMQQLLQALASQKGKFHSSFDLASGFHQIQLKDGISRDITSFCDPVTGLRFRYTCAPFGLSTAPAAMITVLMGIMSSLVSQGIAYVYMDDISVTSPDWPTHLERLETVLKTLDLNNLSCQATKTSLAFPSIKFLGFEVSAVGLKITEDKVKIIKALKPPSDRKALQRVLGLFQFFKHFCPDYSKTTFHMRQNLKKHAQFNWTSQCQAEFENIVHRLTSAPILQPLSVNKDFYFWCDSSYVGTAFAAFQPADDKPDKLHVVGYGGQSLGPTYRTWSVLQIELLAVYHALKTYETYCRHRTINIFSDNISLVYLKGMAMGSPREKRMAAYLMGFRLKFFHVSGKRENMLADTLSRSFEEMNATEIQQWTPVIDTRDDFLFAVSNKFLQKNAEQRSINPDASTIDMHQTAQTRNTWSAYGIEFESRPQVSDIDLGARTKAQQNSDSAILLKTGQQSALRADALPFYPASATACRATGQSVREVERINRTPSSDSSRGSKLQTAQISPSIATTSEDVWYDCATSLEQLRELSEANCVPSSHVARHSGQGTGEISPVSQPHHSGTLQSPQSQQLCVCATKARRRAPKQTSASNDAIHRPVGVPTLPTEPIRQETSTGSHNDADIPVPCIQPSDYITDQYLKNIYIYLTQGSLSNCDQEDRITLLLADDFFVDPEGILYNISLPRGKKANRVQSTEVRLALPQKYIAEVVQRAHELGHFSKERNFEFLRTRFYAKNLWDAVVRFNNSCDRCQRMKRLVNKPVDKLHSLPIPNQPNEMWSTDHLILSRPTVNGETAIIIFIDAFSKWPVIRLVKDTSALHAAQAFVEGVVSVFGLNPNGHLILHSDKGSAYTSSFFKEVCKLLNVRLITSAAQVSTTNGLAEACVKAVKQGIKMFADSDSHLKAAIPLIELSLRCQPHSATHLSPFECVFGRKACLPIIKNEPVNTALTFKGDQQAYYNFIVQRLKEIHEGVKQNIEESKARDEQQYNTRNRAQDPKWTIGQEVLITDKKVKPHSDQILTRPRYHGSFYITDIVQNETFGPSYRLVRTSDGRPLRNLISGSRLRPYTASHRDDFHVKYPKLSRNPADVAQPSANNDNNQGTAEMNTEMQEGDQHDTQATQLSAYEPAIKILKERKRNGKPEFLVLFANKEKCWADKVSPALERAFRVHQEELRKKRRKRRKRY